MKHVKKIAVLGHRKLALEKLDQNICVLVKARRKQLSVFFFLKMRSIKFVMTPHVVSKPMGNEVTSNVWRPSTHKDGSLHNYTRSDGLLWSHPSGSLRLGLFP